MTPFLELCARFLSRTTVAEATGNSHTRRGIKGGSTEVVEKGCGRGVHPVRFNVISRVSLLSPSPSFSFLFIRHPPLPSPNQSFSWCIHNRVATLPPTLRLVLQAFSTSENPRLVRKEEGGGREERWTKKQVGGERGGRMVPRVEEHPSRRRHLEGPISASTSVIPPRFPHTGCR